MTVDRETARRMARWQADPVLFVLEVFSAKPDEWQRQALLSFRDNPRTALSACKGPGKSCVLAWCIWWILACHVDAKGVCMSITEDNLKDNLWTELAKWRSESPMLLRAFLQTAERIKSVERPETWWCSARSFPQQADKKQQANTLAGLHGETVFVVMDEVGDYPDGVVAAADGIYANEVMARTMAAGNPTRVDGPLYAMTTRDADLWHVIHITGDPEDPNRSPRISLEWAQARIDKYGRDNAWVMINVLGQFPPEAPDKLIGINHVVSAQERDARPEAFQRDAYLWGLDPARFGDDASALCRRQGVVCFKFHQWRGLDGVRLAARVGGLIEEARDRSRGPDALFVDVGGVGASAFDHLRLLGYGSIMHGVDFGQKPDSDKYANKRAEMWDLMAQWLKGAVACLPSDGQLVDELTAPSYDWRIVGKQTKLLLESKDSMRKRGVASPNKADALALTFAARVASRRDSELHIAMTETRGRILTEYDPFTGPQDRQPTARELWRDGLHMRS